MVQDILYRLRRYSDVADDQIGIITPYRRQVELLTDSLGSRLSISTVDSFQGSEMEIIIFCTVRANGKNAVGFLPNHQRLNVSVTRSKTALIIVGNAYCLAYGDQSSMWWSYCSYLQENDLYFDENLERTELNLKEPVFVEDSIDRQQPL